MVVAKLHCIVSGSMSGPSLVFLHGLDQSADYFRDIAKSFESAFRVIRVDLRGHGASAKPVVPTSLTELAEDVILLLDSIGAESFALVGFSMGGAVAQQIAISVADRVTALVLVATSSRVGSAARKAYEQMALTSESDGQYALAAVQRAMSSYNMDKQLGALTMPVLVIGGEHDIRTPVRACEILRDCFKTCEYRIFPESGHNVLQDSAESVETINAFLTNHLVRYSSKL